jgi:translin
MADVDSMNATLGSVRERLTELNTARDAAISQSRELIRHCAECIRAIHRHEWEAAQAKFETISEKADELRKTVVDYPELYHTGYTQDALKEVVEAHATYAIIRREALPTAQGLHVEASTYLLGMAEAATELRRFILDIMRRETDHSEEAERLLDWMDAIYNQLITFDFPDALTHGLRRQTDVVRGVLERTRGDLTHSLRQQRLQDALARFEERLENGSA